MPWPISAKCNNLKKTITDENLPVPILRRAASCGDARSGLRSCPEKPEEPKDTEIIFNMPVQNATFGKKYTHDTIVFNKTLGVYTGHTGLDISAEEGSKVVCVYDGVVESVTTSYLQGTTVTIDHGNGLKTVYNSIEAKEGLAAGQALKAGDEIGAVSDNNRQEYKDGAHLHFEVLKDGSKVDPEEYFAA